MEELYVFMQIVFLAATTVKFHLKSLPPSASDDVIAGYFECQGEDVDVLSIEKLQDDEAIISLSGVSEKECSALLSKQHKLKRQIFSVEILAGESSSILIEVSGLSKEVSREYLELYFESKKSGGMEGALEKCVMVQEGIAQLRFKDQEVTDRVLSKEHVLFGSPLQMKRADLELLMVKDEDTHMDELSVTISTVVSPDVLSIYFCALLDLGEEEFTLKVKDTSCSLLLSKSYSQTELKAMCDKINNKKLKRATLTAQLVKVGCSMLVKNIESEDMDEEYLELYFSNPKLSGGKGVKDVNFIGGGMAVITFEDCKVLDGVLQQQHPKLGKNVVVEKYDKANRVGIQDFTRNSFELKPADINPMIMMCIHKNAECLAEGLEKLNLKIAIQPDCLTLTPLKLEMPGNIKKQVMDLVNSHFITKKGVKFPERALQEVTQLVTSLKEALLFEFSFSRNGTVLDVVGDKEAMAQFKTSLKKIHARHTQTEKTFELSVQEYQFAEEVILEQLKVNFPKIVLVLGTSSTMKVSGSVADIEAFTQHFQDAKKHCSIDVNVSPLIVQYFCTPDGKAKVVEFIRKISGAKICLYFHSSPLKLAFLCEPSCLGSAKGIVKHLKKVTSDQEVPLSESFQLVQKELVDFEDFCDTIQRNKDLLILFGDKVIEIAGFRDDVALCAKSLVDYIEENTKLQRNVHIKESLWRLFSAHMREKWDQIVSRARELKIEFTQHFDVDHPHCTLFGDIVNVNTIADSINCLKSSVHKKVVEIDRPGTCELFRSSKGKVYLRGIESQEKVAIEVCVGELEETSDDESSPDQHASAIPSICDTKCTALINHIRVNVCLGDITEFEADVIVNAANDWLSHDGGVARAIADKGGPAIQDDCTQHVTQRGTVNTGSIYFTKTTGNLRCKALIHAVGPVWTDGRMKEEELLHKVCMKSLSKSQSQGYRSIVFPAISSGIYGFPIKKCASTMIQAMIDFSKANPASSLRDVTFVLLPDPAHAQEASVFVAKLKESLPQEKVQVESHPMPLPLQASAIPTSKAKASRAHVSYGSPVQFKSYASSAEYAPPRTRDEAESIPVFQRSVMEKIKLRKGSLLDVKADVYVNTTNTNLKLSQGAVSSALLKAGGTELQQECSQKAPIRVGDVASTGPGKLPCQLVFHNVLPSYRQLAEKVLASSIRKCLKKCDLRRMKSIAFPSIGTGNLGYPNDVVAKIMVKEVFDYLSANDKSCIEQVYLVIFMQDTFDSFKKEIDAYVTNLSSLVLAENRQKKKRAPLHSSFPGKPTPAFCPKSRSFSISSANVNVICGNVTASNRDVIVSPTDSSTIFPTNQGIASVIFQKGGNELKQLCHALVSNGKILNDSTLVLETRATGSLKSRSIFHICFEGRDSKQFVKIVVQCLRKADRMGYTSIAFPAIGTGVQGYPDEQAATAMLTAIHQCSKQLRHLKTIDIVLYQAPVFEAFAQVFQNPSFLEACKMKYAESPTVNSAGKSDFIPLEDPKLKILIYAETVEYAVNAEKKFNQFVDESFLNDIIRHPLINDLTRENELAIIKSAKHVQVCVDRHPLNQIVLHGETSRVQEVKFGIVEKLSAMEKNAAKQREASQLSQTIRWKRLTSDRQEEYYDDITNCEIERAYSENPNGNYTRGGLQSGVYFTISFKEMREVDHIGRTRSEVVREDVLNKGGVPDYWDDMPQGKTLHIVTLDPKSKEYQEVLQSFEATMRQYPIPTSLSGSIADLFVGAYVASSTTSLFQSSAPASVQPRFKSARKQAPLPLSTGRSSSYYSSIVRIQRIQNHVLYSQYAARKKVMDDNNPTGCQNERKLFHGTTPDTCLKVNQQGFNRSFAGKNAIAYGNGVYFARDASYSARQTYSPPDANGHKYVYYARVLTGVYTQGQRGLLVPPPKDPDNPTILCDSVVDNVSNPNLFVTFHDASNYPDYLIVFD